MNTELQNWALDDMVVDGIWPTLHAGEPIPFEPVVGGFEVDELDAYPASGQGDHLFVRIRKRGISTTEVVHRIADATGVKSGDVGFAGRKDAVGITTQRFSVPRTAESSLAAIDGAQITVMETAAHQNKLRLGHLAGNRFVVRGICDFSGRLLERVEQIRHKGMPNYYGMQRFGRDHHTIFQGLELLRRGRSRRGRRQDGFEISALQSMLFNDYVALRIGRLLFESAVDGDVLKTTRGGLFVCADPAVDGPRVQQGEVTVTGPMFGKKMRPALGTSLTLESEILSRRGLTFDDFSSFRPPIPGTRRAIRVLSTDLEVVQEAGSITVTFSLPAGSFATVLLREMFRISIVLR